MGFLIANPISVHWVGICTIVRYCRGNCYHTYQTLVAPSKACSFTSALSPPSSQCESLRDSCQVVSSFTFFSALSLWRSAAEQSVVGLNAEKLLAAPFLCIQSCESKHRKGGFNVTSLFNSTCLFLGCRDRGGNCLEPWDGRGQLIVLVNNNDNSVRTPLWFCAGHYNDMSRNLIRGPHTISLLGAW